MGLPTIERGTTKTLDWAIEIFTGTNVLKIVRYSYENNLEASFRKPNNKNKQYSEQNSRQLLLYVYKHSELDFFKRNHL